MEASATDEKLAAAIAARLTTDCTLGGLPIKVEVNRGLVILKGKVDRPEQKEHAQEVACAVMGAVECLNQLEVMESD